MDYLTAMRAFVRAVELGSFSRAADELGTKVSTVSRYVSSLEADLGAALLNRSTRKLHLTEVGTGFYDRSIRILAELDEARIGAREFNQKPQGLLRISIPAAFGRLHLMPHLPRFLETYPDIRADIRFDDDIVDIIAAGIDVAVRIGALNDSSLVATKLANQHRRLVVRSDAGRALASIRTPADLAGQDCLVFSLRSGSTWFARPRSEKDSISISVEGRLRANDSEALLSAVLDGLGIALLPDWLVVEPLRDGRLLELLPDYAWTIEQGPEPAIWGVYPPKKTVSPKVRAFIDFAKTTFSAIATGT